MIEQTYHPKHRKMSKINFKDFKELEDLINYCLENDIHTLLNDYSPEPWVEYSLSDMYEVWEQFRFKFDESKKYK